MKQVDNIKKPPKKEILLQGIFLSISLLGSSLILISNYFNIYPEINTETINILGIMLLAFSCVHLFMFLILVKNLRFVKLNSYES